MGFMNVIRTIVCLLYCLAALPAVAETIVLGQPLDCVMGSNCWIQQYVDHDATAGIKDYRCGHETYDGHDGTDFRVLDTTAQVAVLASAAGVVKGMRDGVDDRLMKSDSDRAAVQKIECGNGVVINHPGGWQTQYCHMRKGSVVVKAGDAVAAGAKLGEVGYSGMAAFPHVHLTVRHNGKALDPFGGSKECGLDGASLWNAEAQKSLSYRQGDFLGTGFHNGPVDVADLESGRIAKENPTRDWPALVAYMWAINLSKGDKITVTLRGPDGVVAENSVTLDRKKAQYLLFAGKKRPAAGWPAGEYRGRVTVTNGGEVRFQREWQAEVGG
jgi:Peptidase family M23